MSNRAIPTPHTPTTFFLPADDLRAAFQCVSDTSAGYYLNGVYCTRQELVATDGHQMIQIATPSEAHIGKDCLTQDHPVPRGAMPGTAGGFLLHADHTDKAWKAKTFAGGDLWVYGDVTTGLLQFVSKPGSYAPGDELYRVGVLEFSRIDGTFPDYTHVVPNAAGKCGVFCHAPAVMAKLLKAADVLRPGKHTPAVRLTTGDGPGDPALVEFAGLPRVRGTIMPHRWRE